MNQKDLLAAYYKYEHKQRSEYDKLKFCTGGREPDA